MAADQAQLEQRISNDFASLSKRLQQVARYVLDNPNDVAFGTVASIAEKAGVHASTLVRFAHAFDFDGFSEMQQLFKNKLLDAAPDYSSRMRSVLQDQSIDEDKSGIAWLQQVCAANSQAMQVMCEQINPQAIQQAIELLSQADIVHIQGVRRSFPTASYFSYLLSNIGKRAHLLEGVGHMRNAQQSLISSQDVLFAISFYPYAPETQQVAEHARQTGAKIIALTDSPLSPLCELADVCIKLKEAEVHAFRSLNASMNLIQALVLGLIHQTQAED